MSVQEESLSLALSYINRGIDNLTNQEKGEILEITTSLALDQIGESYMDTTGMKKDKHNPDFLTKRTTLECKNYIGSTFNRYCITLQKYETQIRSRFDLTSKKYKILIEIEGTKWLHRAKKLVKTDNIKIIRVKLIDSVQSFFEAIDHLVDQLKIYVIDYRDKGIINIKLNKTSKYENMEQVKLIDPSRYRLKITAKDQDQWEMYTPRVINYVLSGYVEQFIEEETPRLKPSPDTPLNLSS